jgi:hypothetical protein
MRMNGKARGLLLAAAFCASVPAGATTLTIVNPSFESPIDTGGTLSQVPTGWYGIAGLNTDNGVWNINQYPLGSWDDPVALVNLKQVAYLNGPFSSSSASQGGIYQPLKWDDGSIIAYDPTLPYALTGVVGFPEVKSSSLPSTRLYTFSLLAGSMFLGSVSGDGPVRTLANFTLLIPAGTHTELAGQQLTIRLLSVDAEVAVDNLVLQATPVPEPDSVALLVLGMGLLAFRLHRRNTRN